MTGLLSMFCYAKETDAEEKQQVPHESHITEFQASTAVSLCSYWMSCIYLSNNHVKIRYFSTL